LSPAERKFQPFKTPIDVETHRQFIHAQPSHICGIM
jgi:hypothetical protein